MDRSHHVFFSDLINRLSNKCGVKWLLPIFSLGLFSLLLCGQLLAADSQNLIQIYQQALSQDPALASAKSGNLAMQEKLVQGRAQYLPTISFNAGASASKTDIKIIGIAPFRNTGRETFEGYNYGVNLNQPIYRKQIQVQLEQAKSQVEQSNKQLQLTQQNLILRSSKAYFDVLLAQDKIELIQAQKNAISKQLEQAKANFDVGTATITDFNEAQARFDLVQAQEIAAMSDLEVKKRAIQSIIGQMPATLRGVRSDLQPHMPEPLAMERWVEMATQTNLMIAIQEQALEIATQELERQNAGHLPTLDASASYTERYANGGINSFGSDLKDATIGLQLQIPLYQGGAVSSRVREAVANKQKAMDDVVAARRQAELETRQAYLDLVSVVSQIKAYEQALNSSQSQLDSTSLGYEVGVRTSVDVLNAQQQFFTAKRDLLQSRYAYLMNILTLKFAVGLLTESDLEAVNQQLV
jgi:outer membrane protein